MLAKNEKFRADVERLMSAYRLIQGTRECPTFEETVNNTSLLVAILEANPDLKTTANSGGITVTRSFGEGFEIHLWAARVGPYRERDGH